MVYLFQLCFLYIVLFLKYSKTDESPYEIYRSRLTIKSITKEFTTDYFANYTNIKVSYKFGYDYTINKLKLSLNNHRFSAPSCRKMTMSNKISVGTQNMLNQIVYPQFCTLW